MYIPVARITQNSLSKTNMCYLSFTLPLLDTLIPLLGVLLFQLLPFHIFLSQCVA